MAEGGESKSDRFVKRLDFSAANLATKWKTFKSEFDIHKIVKKYSEMTAEEQIANLLVQMGNGSIPIFRQFVFEAKEVDEGKNKTLNNVIAMFDTYFEPVKNVIFERSLFNKMTQEQNQTIHQFILALQDQATNCEYAAMKDELIRDRIVVGVRDNKLREYLIDTPELTLHKCIQKAKQYVTNHEHSAKIGQTAQNSGADNVDYVATPNKQGYKDSAHKQGKVSYDKVVKLDKPCKKCGKWSHFSGKCPADKTKCKKCDKTGHWAKMCLEKRSVSQLEQAVVDTLYIGSDSDSQ